MLCRPSSSVATFSFSYALFYFFFFASSLEYVMNNWVERASKRLSKLKTPLLQLPADSLAQFDFRQHEKAMILTSFPAVYFLLFLRAFRPPTNKPFIFFGFFPAEWNSLCFSRI